MIPKSMVIFDPEKMVNTLYIFVAFLKDCIMLLIKIQNIFKVTGYKITGILRLIRGGIADVK